MFRKFDIRIPILLTLNILYIFIISTLNGELAPYAYLMLPAVFILAPALFLEFFGMLFVVGVSAFLVEATTPVRTGMTAALWLAVAFWVHGWRFRLKNLDTMQIIGMAEAVNILIILVFAVFMKSGSTSFSAFFVRLLGDAAISAAVLAVCAKFTVLLPVSVMNFLGLGMSVSGEDK